MDPQYLSFLTAWLLTIILTPASILLLWRFKIIDDPIKHKHIKVIHTYPVPRGGGLPIIMALLVSSVLFFPMDNHSLAIIIAAIITVVVGLIDDYFDISPYIRLFTNLLAALVVIGQGIFVKFITNPFTGQPFDLLIYKIDLNLYTYSISIPIVAVLFTVIWIVGLMNMIGQGAGGVEGQLPGVVVIASFVVAIMSDRFSADITLWPVSTLAMAVAGAYLGFLAYNFFPQRIMPGYSGKSLAGLLLAIMSILSTAKIGLLIIVLGLPLIDTMLTYIRRLWLRKSPLLGDRGHLHHLFLDHGLTKPQIVLIYWAITVLLGLMALNINSQQKMYVIVLITLAISLIIILLKRNQKYTKG